MMRQSLKVPLKWCAYVCRKWPQADQRQKGVGWGRSAVPHKSRECLGGAFFRKMPLILLKERKTPAENRKVEILWTFVLA